MTKSIAPESARGQASAAFPSPNGTAAPATDATAPWETWQTQPAIDRTPPEAFPMPVTIRSRLLLLVLSILLPGMLGAAWLIGVTVQAERSAYESTLRDSARALSVVVDRELAQRSVVARVLAQSRWLDDAPDVTPEQLVAFEKLARRALEGLDGWIEVRTAERTLLDTRLGAGVTSSAKAGGLSAIPLVLPLRMGGAGSGENSGTNSGTDSGAVGGTDGGTDVGQDAHAALVYPVERNGRVVLNLLVTLIPAELQRVVDAQRLPDGWVVSILDDQGTLLARHPGGKANIGRRATADLRERLTAAPEGLFESISLDGVRVTGYYSTSPRGWSYVSEMPREQFAGLARRAVLQVALGTFLLVALAVAGALGVARRIVEPVRAMKDAATRMQAGQPVLAGSTGLVECDEVARAMDDAASAIARGRSDLEAQVAAAVERTRLAEQRLSQGQRVEALGRLTGGVAHDFNNLLGVVSNSVHLIMRHPAAAELQVPLSATLRAVDTGSQLTQHLLRFTGRRPVRPQAVELGHYLPEVLELVRSVLGSRFEIRVHVAPDTDPVRVDSSELELALINLALNARDAMPAGGELHLSARNATALDFEDFGEPPDAPPQRRVLITVGDNGPGIDPELAAHVFEPFFTTKPVGQGTGLGLSQVHGFCVQAGGAARLASTPGVGTTVSMLLPAMPAVLDLDGAAQAAAAAAAARAEVQASAAASIVGARVLLVDDNEALGDVTAALLTTHGAQVRRAGDAAQALREMATNPLVDAVLSDVVMAGPMDGLTLARALRRQHPTLPVVLISGYGTVASMSEFPFLRKPCPPEELLAALGNAIAQAATLRPPVPPAGRSGL